MDLKIAQQHPTLLLFIQYYYVMNFLSFLTSGSSLFNSKLQNTPALASIALKPENNGIVPKGQQIPQEKPVVSISSEGTSEQLASSAAIDSSLPEMILTQQQQLINQYMHLNLQLMGQKIQALQSQNGEKVEESQIQPTVRSFKKKIKKMNTCGHEDKQHYAKGMCNNCYHKYGRTKKPWSCPHDKLYASGMCQNCYINKYNRKKREQLQDSSSRTQVKEEDCSQKEE